MDEAVDEPSYLRKNYKFETVDVHPSERALVVHYLVEAIFYGDQGQVMIGDSKECQKIIRVSDLNVHTDISELSQQILHKCHLIPTNKLPEVEQLLYYLQNRKEVDKDSDKRHGDIHDTPSDPPIADSNINETANINDLDSYFEMLYEDKVEEQRRGSALILQLARQPDNLEVIARHESLLGALDRMLRGECKKSPELATNVVYIFFCFSSFEQFHSIIQHFRIGAVCLQIIETELLKYEHFLNDAKSKKGDVKSYLQNKNDVILKQEHLLRVCLYLLLNISSNPTIEKKMVNKSILTLLVRSLQFTSPDLLVLVVSFLKKLSIFAVNKDQLKQTKIIEYITQYVPTKSEDLLNVVLRLLLNLSFDKELRGKMVKIGMLPNLIELLSDDKLRVVTMCLLYHISIDDQHKKLFKEIQCIEGLMKIFLKCLVKADQMDDGVGANADKECYDLVTALLINLATDKDCAKVIARSKFIHKVVERAMSMSDFVLMKLVRNMAQHERLRASFVDYIGDFVEALMQTDKDEAFQVECCAILANLQINDLDYALIVEEFNLLGWIGGKLCDKTLEDDYLLEVVNLVCTLCSDRESARLIATHKNMVGILIRILNQKQEDDEIVCQIIYTFYLLVLHSETRSYMIKETQAADYLLDLMHDKNNEIRKICDAALEIIQEVDEKWTNRIQVERFRWFNSQWLDMIESRSGGVEYDYGGGDMFDEDRRMYFDQSLMDYCDGTLDRAAAMNLGYEFANNIDVDDVEYSDESR